MDEFSDLIPRFDLQGMDLQLDRMRAALHELEGPYRDVPAIQVAGTNGKGSIVRFIETALLRADVPCGVTTSPHLISWCERIRVEGELIPAATLRSLLLNLQEVSRHNRLTPFELLTTAALVHFQCQCVELLVLEVALSVVTTRMEQSVETLERETLQALDNFSRNANKNNLERLRFVKDKQSRLEYRLEGVREELQRFLDDDEDMVKMVLSRQNYLTPGSGVARSTDEVEVSGRGALSSSGEERHSGEGTEKMPVARASLTPGEHIDLDMVEELLEHYYATLDHCYDRAKAMEDFIENSERVINIGLDTARNSLIRLELVLTASTFSLTLWEVVGAVLGENVEIPSFMGQNHPAFWYINGATLLACLMVFALIVSYCRSERLL